LEHRLALLVQLNTPELIRQRGAYKSYWDDETTHLYPPYKRQIRALNSSQVRMNLGGLIEK